MRISTFEIDMVASRLKQLGLGDYYVAQILTNEVNAYSGYDLVDKVRRMKLSGLGDAAIAACLIKRSELKSFGSELNKFLWELDESEHQKKLDRIRREKELEAARSRPAVRRTYEEEVTSSVLNIMDSVFEIGSILLSSKRK